MLSDKFVSAGKELNTFKKPVAAPYVRKAFVCKGGKAKLIFEMDSLMKPGKVETCEWEMVKTGGKWLVKKSVSRYKK